MQDYVVRMHKDASEDKKMQINNNKAYGCSFHNKTLYAYKEYENKDVINFSFQS